MTILAGVLLLGGFFFLFAGVLGVMRLPDFYTRLHAMGKCDTLGMLLIIAGIMVHEGLTLVSLKLLAIWLFVILANPTATHALSRAAFRAGLKPWKRTGGQ